MHSADASTPAPTYGDVEALEQALDGAVLAERPVQGGEHDVGAVEAAAGLERDRSRRPAATHRRGRSRSRSARGPPRASPSRTDAAEASETSCSDERPPPSTATRSGLTDGGVVGRGRGVVGGGRRGRRRRELADDDRDRAALLGAACPRPGSGRGRSRPSSCRSRSWWSATTLKPAAGSVLRAPTPCRRRRSGTFAVVGALRDHDRDGRSRDRLRPAGRGLADHVAGGRARRLLGRRRHREAGVRERPPSPSAAF